MTHYPLNNDTCIDISYPTPAPGWIDGVYTPRSSTSSSTASHLVSSNGLTAVHSRIWKETEETGFGIYLYEDTSLLSLALSSGFYNVHVTLVNPDNIELKCYLKANGIVKTDDLTLFPGQERTVTLFTSVLDDSLTLGFLHGNPEDHTEQPKEGTVYVKSIMITQLPEKQPAERPRIFLASDSTVQNYEPKDKPQTGWGQQLPNYVNLEIINRAIGGRSSRSFVVENRLDKIFEDLMPNDYLFVQFAHNDATKERPNRYVAPNEFSEFLMPFIRGCELIGATCVLVTPVARRNYDEHGEFKISFPEYRKIMFDLAEAHNLPILDLGKATTEFLRTQEPEASKEYYMWLPAGIYDHDRYRDGLKDDTHLNEKGADIYASILAQLIRDYDEDDVFDCINIRL